MEIALILWCEWEQTWWLDTPRYWTHTADRPSSGNDWGHSLIELGDTTDGYRYTFYYKGRPLICKLLRPPCCTKLPKCPIGHYSVPMSPCREHLRVYAKGMAQTEWEGFLRSIAEV